MEFDFAHVSVPFRMRPGLSRLEPDAVHLTPLRPGSALHTEKSALLRQGNSHLALAGFDAGPVLAAIRAQALKAGVTAQDADTLPLELQVEEDLVVLDTATAIVPWLSVSVPSRWAPEEKLGQTLGSIHAPVADGHALAAALPHLLRVLSNGTHWERYVWTVSPSPRYDQHPHRNARPEWPSTSDPSAFAQQCFFRAERQTFLPLLGAAGKPGPQVLFTIRVMVEPLAAVLRQPPDALRLHDAIASMSEAVLAYKSLAPARDRLLRWLSLRAPSAGDAVPGRV
jgi:hypothetical protein